MATSTTSAAAASLLQFELLNDIHPLSAEDEQLYYQQPAEAAAMANDRPWRQDPRYFQQVRMSVQALVKMATHARRGGDLEVMGLMFGRVVGRMMVVMDAFALPVEGTETRVNAANEALEYMIQFKEASRASGRREHVIGWYHSHPGYGCWLSGIDVQTQRNNQLMDPFLAVVVDPVRSVVMGGVDVGAFRTLPAETAGQTPSAEDATRTIVKKSSQAIPLEKVADFGAHATQYYQLPISFFKSSLDSELLSQVWEQYWQQSLASSTLFGGSTAASGGGKHAWVTKEVQDLRDKLARISGSSFGASQGSGGGNSKRRRQAVRSSTAEEPTETAAQPAATTEEANDERTRLHESHQQCAHLCHQLANGLMLELVKMRLFGDSSQDDANTIATSGK